MQNQASVSFIANFHRCGVLILLALMAGCMPLNDQTVQSSQPAAQNEPMDASSSEANTSQAPESASESPNVNPAVKQLLVSAAQQMNQQQYDKAVSTCERAIRIDPRNAAAYRQLAEIKFQQGKISEAEQFARKGLSVSKQSNFWLLNNERSRLESLLEDIQQAKLRG